jgi:hypothetical protein
MGYVSYEVCLHDKLRELWMSLAVGKARVGGGISLRVLLEEGMLRPGEGVLSVEYKGICTYADLLPDGKIACLVGPVAFHHGWAWPRSHPYPTVIGCP